MSTAPSDAAGLSPTPAASRVRFAVVGVATLASVLLYLHRNALGIAGDYMREDLELTTQQWSWVVSAFFWSYALSQVPSGWFTDVFGGRRMLTAYIVAWSICTVATGLVGGLASLILARLACGVSQAGAYPTAAGLLRQWAPVQTRGVASSVVALGGRAGGFLAPLLTAWCIVALTPIDGPSRLEPTDVLNTVGLAKAVVARIAAEEKDPAVEPIVGRRFAPAALVRTRGLAQGATPTDADRVLLTEELNRWIADPAPADEDKTSLTPAESERRNRLAVESYFPGQVRRVYSRGWRPVFLVYGAMGLVAAVLVWVVLRDRPSRHPWCNDAERRFIAGGDAAAITAAESPPLSKAPPLALYQLATHWSMCMNSAGQFFTNVGWVFIVSQLNTFYDEKQVPIETTGLYASLPLFVGWFGMMLGGWWTDALTRRAGLRWGRSVPRAAAGLLAAAAYVACLFDPSVLTVTIAMCVVAFATDVG
ncbi:MAG: MFS transporter, partial [Planctomycetia bacterium]